ncbi:HNH endonuclease [Marinobacterium mangrovicola]|uniref:HNH endonuclease n=1 Tax=Marinobacterium mangrovicola TaxID=1476959 RepID=A0A4R1G947_9GAMM|nr:HNH endonuclease signature motif containing protein [Marinobacterium mangrovicola]TCK03005.1 HNH endonuclease [Marinobacterium mangrovicola]
MSRKKRGWKPTKMETMALNHQPKSGLVKSPRQSHGPLASLDIEKYMREKLGHHLTHERPVEPHEAVSTNQEGNNQPIQEVQFLTREAIGEILQNAELEELESLWSDRKQKIQYKEDAYAVFSKIRFLEGIDSIIRPYEDLADSPLLSSFEEYGDDLHGPTITPEPSQEYTLEGDKRLRLTTLTARDGQARFRNELIQHYDLRCMVTGEAIEAIVEAAHIMPYDGNKSNHISNGLLLRVDIHRLFDNHLLTIEPHTFKIHLHPSLEKSSYSYLQNQPLRLQHENLIDNEALAKRFKEALYIN